MVIIHPFWCLRGARCAVPITMTEICVLIAARNVSCVTVRSVTRGQAGDVAIIIMMARDANQKIR
jgi:hypothetical protein